MPSASTWGHIEVALSQASRIELDDGAIDVQYFASGAGPTLCMYAQVSDFQFSPAKPSNATDVDLTAYRRFNVRPRNGFKYK